jgi:hypothetical protein
VTSSRRSVPSHPRSRKGAADPLDPRSHSLLQPSPSVAIHCNGLSIASESRTMIAQSPPIFSKPSPSVMAQNLIATSQMGSHQDLASSGFPSRADSQGAYANPQGPYANPQGPHSDRGRNRAVEWRMEP